MNILAAVDFSPVTVQVLATVKQIAATFPARIWLVHVVPPDPAFVGYEAGPDVVRDQVAGEHHARHQQLQEMAERLRSDGVDTTALLLQGATVATLIAEAERLQATLIVLGSHGHGAMYDLLVGSVSEGVVRAAKLPVLLVPARQ
ncbi:MAG TPA: universal stress protein [Steroidobacteraceae bacterium]